jgi:LacI family transcriptional regulator
VEAEGEKPWEATCRRLPTWRGRLGVSVSTVSHIINGTRRVSPATASAVRAVIDATAYHPNVVARSLKTASTRSVGIAISAIANPYFTGIICAIETECARLGMMIFLSTPRMTRLARLPS